MYESHDILHHDISCDTKRFRIADVKRIIFLINGNYSFHGKLILVDPKIHGEFTRFLKFLNSQLSRFLLQSQKIKRVLTPRGGNTVHSISQLNSGGVYVCAGNETFKKLNNSCLHFGRINGLNVQMNDLSKINPLLRRPKVKELAKSNRISKIILPGTNQRDNICTNLKIIPSVKHNLNAKDFSSVTNKLDVNSVSRVAVNNGQLIDSDCNTNKTLNNKNTIKITKILRLLPSDNQKYGGRKITVVRCNPGGKGRTSLTVMMARRSVHTLGQVMCELTEAFGSRWHNDPIRNLYSLTGREIKSVNELFRKDKVFIASGLHKMFGNIHIELNKSNNVDSNTTRANNYINNCIHQSMSYNNCQKSFHHGFLSNQDKNGNIVGSNATELKPEDIRAILSEFWPDHPDPSSVVYQWERRLRNRGFGMKTSQQFDVNKHLLFEIPRPKQKLSLKTNNIISNINYSSNESFIENEKKDSGFDELTINNNILPKIDEEQIHGEQSILFTNNSINFMKDQPNKLSSVESHSKLLKQVNSPQHLEYVKPNHNYSNFKLDSSSPSTIEENNFFHSEKFFEELSLTNKSSIKLHENTFNTKRLLKPQVLKPDNINNDMNNTSLHANSVTSFSPFYYSVYQQNLSRNQQKSYQIPVYPFHSPFLLSTSLFQQQHRNQQLKKSDSLSKLLSRYHNCLQIGERVLQRTENRRHELAMKENKLPENHHVDKVVNRNSLEIKTHEKNLSKLTNYQEDKVQNLNNNPTKLTMSTYTTTIDNNDAQINKIGPHTGESKQHSSKLTDQSFIAQQFKLNQQLKTNTSVTNNNTSSITKNKDSNTSSVINKTQGNLSNITFGKQSHQTLQSNHNVKRNDNTNPCNNKGFIEKGKSLVDINKPVLINDKSKIRENHIINDQDNNIRIETKLQKMDNVSDATKSDHSPGIQKEISSEKKSLPAERAVLNAQQNSPKLPMNKTYDKDVNQTPKENNNDITRCNANVNITTQQNLDSNAPDVVTNNIITTAATNNNHTSSVKLLDVSDDAQQKLIGNCFTVSGLKKPNNDKLKSVYTAVGVTYVSDPDYLSKRYQIGRKLGDGNFAIVKLGKRRDTNDQYALKIIEKSKLTGKEAMLLNEIHILHHCRHPNIVRLYEEFETASEIWLVMEFIKDGDLFDGITQATKFTEPIAAGIVSDLASALFYLHCRSIVHRDLKPENILLLRQKNGQIRVKLADFGLALVVKKSMYTVCGTPTYIAPEILEESGYGLEVDMWALGIITYIMLCGFAPFRSTDRRQSKLFESIKRGHFVFLSPYWDNISSHAKDLITALLVITPKSRLTARETLAHPWVFGSGLPNLSEEFEKRRLDYRNELEKKHNEFKQSMNEKNPIDLYDKKNNNNKDNINQNNKFIDMKKLELPRITKIKELYN
ncbi:unnamed protein product [Schistosoma rodhaini]|nr:unnamed protein product [Schistosoma rodhaini]